jgi:hypothetical protein
MATSPGRPHARAAYLSLAGSASPMLCRLTLHAAQGGAPFAVAAGERLHRSGLGALIRERWMNLVAEYPEFGFERLEVHPDRIEALVRVPPCAEQLGQLRGVVAHFKAMVTRDAPAERSVWAPGYSAEPLPSSGNGTSSVRPSRATTVSGKIARASASSSGASRV